MCVANGASTHQASLDTLTANLQNNAATSFQELSDSTGISIDVLSNLVAQALVVLVSLFHMTSQSDI
jgi:hypothetical protein